MRRIRNLLNISVAQVIIFIPTFDLSHTLDSANRWINAFLSFFDCLFNEILTLFLIRNVLHFLNCQSSSMVQTIKKIFVFWLLFLDKLRDILLSSWRNHFYIHIFGCPKFVASKTCLRRQGSFKKFVLVNLYMIYHKKLLSSDFSGQKYTQFIERIPEKSWYDLINIQFRSRFDHR